MPMCQGCVYTLRCVYVYTSSSGLFMHICEEVHVYFRKQCGGMCICVLVVHTCAVPGFLIGLLRDDLQSLVRVLSRDS